MANDEFSAEKAIGGESELIDRLIREAMRRMGLSIRRRIDPEDVVQSVCRSILQRGEAEFLENPEQFWGLLVYRVDCKVQKKVRHELAQRRDLRKEVHVDALDGGGELFGACTEERPEEAAAIAEDAERLTGTLNTLLNRLTPTYRAIITLFLEGCQTKEIYQKVGCSERAVSRAKKRARQILEDLSESRATISSGNE